MILHYGGSAKRYRAALKSRNTPAHKIRTLAVYRKALNEYKNDVYVHTDWSTNLSTAMATFKAAIPAKNLKGYIQNIEKDGHLEITVFSEKQYECLFKTPYNDRVLHIDATGSQVKVKKQNIQQVEDLCVYKRILNYYLLVKNMGIEKPDQSSFQLGTKIVN